VLVPRTGTIEGKVEQLRELESKTDPQQLADFQYRLEVSWIHHDGALEGVVYDPRELQAAIDNQQALISDRALQATYDEIRNFRMAIALIREMGEKKRRKVTLDVIKKIYLTLAPEEEEVKGPLKYRKEMPLHRVYFHEISSPDKIGYRMRQLVEWMASDETKRTVHPVRMAAKAHSILLHIFPFPKHSGKVARLMMNLMLLRDGYPPAIVHSTERQRYYEALKVSDDAVAVVVRDALTNSVDSALRFFKKLHGIPDKTPE
jgi:Fic family protein